MAVYYNISHHFSLLRGTDLLWEPLGGLFPTGGQNRSQNSPWLARSKLYLENNGWRWGEGQTDLRSLTEGDLADQDGLTRPAIPDTWRLLPGESVLFIVLERDVCLFHIPNILFFWGGERLHPWYVWILNMLSVTHRERRDEMPCTLPKDFVFKSSFCFHF